MIFKKGLVVCLCSLFWVYFLTGQTDALRIEADALTNEEAYEAANLIYKELGDTYFEQKEFLKYADVSIALANNLNALEKDQEAINVLSSLIDSTIISLPNDSLLALVYHKLGTTYYIGFNDDEQSISYWQQSLKIRENIFAANHIDIIRLYRNLGNSFLNIKQYQKAKIHFQKAADIHLTRAQKNEKLLAKTYNDLGNIYAILNDYDKAGKYAKIALEDYKRLWREEPWELYYPYENIFDWFTVQEEYQQMVNSQKEILQLYEKVEDKWEDDYIKIANIHNNLGLAYDLLDSLSLALKHYNKSLAINQTYVTNNAEALAINYNNLANIYAKQQRSALALESIELAIDYDEKSGNLIGQALNLNDKAVMLLAANKDKEALNTIKKAIFLLQPDGQSALIYDKPLLVELLGEKLKILKKLSKKNTFILEEVPSITHQIVDLINEVRIKFQSDASKQFLSKKSRPILEDAVSLNIQLYKEKQDTSFLNDALQLTQLAKSIILMDALQQAELNRTVAIPAQFLEREDQLKEQIAEYEKKLFLQKEENIALNKELVLLNRQLEILQDSLQRKFPTYAVLKYTTPTIHFEDLNLSENQTIIDYFITEQIIYAFIIGQKGIELAELPRDFPLKTYITQLQKGLLTYHLKNLRAQQLFEAYADTLLQSAHQLYQHIFAPISNQHTLTKELIIIADGILGYLPFDILLQAPAKDITSFNDHKYLLFDHQISYCYSAALLIEMQQKKHNKATKNLIAFAPTFGNPKVLAENTRSPSLGIRSGLTPLTYNIPEVQTIQQIIGGDILIAEEATKTNFAELAHQYKIIHLSTHGKANDLMGDYAFLAFSKEEVTTENELLYNRDLYNLELNADMVVLSACETGIGELQKGEGIISLARGFSYAGAKSILTTLWSVNDAKTKEIMEIFYLHLKKGLPKDKAIRQAKLEFIDNYGYDAHPFFWAAFIPVGDMSPIHLGTTINYPILLGAILLLALLALFFYQRRKNNL